MKDNPLDLILSPDSIAFYGANNNITKMGTLMLLNMMEFGYAGDIYPIHPKEDSVLGLRAYRRADEVDKKIDMAIFVLPTERVAEAVEDAGKAGVSRGIVISGGFKEAGDDGMSREEALKGAAEKFDFRFLGPNCIGVANCKAKLNTTPMYLSSPGGGIGIASQSGAYTCHIFPYIQQRGMKIARTVSVGNEADVDLVDAVDHLADCEEVKTIALYVEMIRRPRDFVEVCREASRKKPVVAMYVGGTEGSARATLSHTGSLSGSDEIYDGLFRQAGVIRVKTVQELLDCAWALSLMPAARGKRVAILTNSGGPGTAMAYCCEKLGMKLPLLSEGIQRKLLDRIGTPTAYVLNPVDSTFNIDVLMFGDLARIIFEEDGADGALIYGIFGSEFFEAIKRRYPEAEETFIASFGKQYEEGLADISEIAGSFKKPLLVSSFFSTKDDAVSALLKTGTPVYSTPEQSVTAMWALMEYGAMLNEKEES